ncbi:MAG: hypothetical protein FD172_4050 [Methylocystaceae bacterium]|nr:MAG: hypothetical protein FD172_4050 [Methylocystaceae bacterium]
MPPVPIQTVFYHGMLVRRGNDELVLLGPPVLFTPGQAEQMTLI